MEVREVKRLSALFCTILLKRRMDSPKTLAAPKRDKKVLISGIKEL
jgi:hypothetical protein